MTLRPQDIVVLLKLVALADAPQSYQGLAKALGMSASEVHQALRRCVTARLAAKDEHGVRPVRPALFEFLSHGVQYAFAAERGGLVRGVPTGSAAPPLVAEMAGTDAPPWVWPDPGGTVRGLAFAPLYKSVPHAARADANLYALLALVDAIRGGDARERRLARAELASRLGAA
jgi:hypothetical protein